MQIASNKQAKEIQLSSVGEGKHIAGFGGGPDHSSVRGHMGRPGVRIGFGLTVSANVLVVPVRVLRWIWEERCFSKSSGHHSTERSAMDIIFTILASIAVACSDRKNLPKALISGGIFKAAAALCLVFFQGPGGVFLHHGKAPYYLYYGILVTIAIFGLVEASVGCWVSGRLDDRHAAGKAVLCVSILPLVCVAAFGGFVVLRKVN